MFRKLFFTVFFLAAALTMGLLVNELGAGEVEGPPPTPVLSEKQQAMQWAAQQGNTLFLHNSGGYALCKGTSYLVKLPLGKRRSIDFTADETANLSLCRQSADNPSMYSKVRDISGTSPGDFLVWDTDGVLNWSRYD